jgi:hypothetical protein
LEILETTVVVGLQTNIIQQRKYRVVKCGMGFYQYFFLILLDYLILQLNLSVPEKRNSEQDINTIKPIIETIFFCDFETVLLGERLQILV